MIDRFPFIVPHWTGYILALPAIPALGALIGSGITALTAAAPAITAVSGLAGAGAGIVEGVQAAAAGREQKKASEAETAALGNIPKGPTPSQSPVGSPTSLVPKQNPSFLASAGAPTQAQSGRTSLLGS